MDTELFVGTKKYACGAFRNAFHATGKESSKDLETKEWVVITYNAWEKITIGGTANTSVEDHCAKQVQMHAV